MLLALFSAPAQASSKHLSSPAVQGGDIRGFMEPTPYPLWPEGTVFAENVTPPTLTRYDPPAGKANGASVVVCPGGGYGMLADHEGGVVACWLNTLGIMAFVLHYRLGPHSRHPAMLQDVARAVRWVRGQEEDLDPSRIGILGFSAGGHLASTLATHFEAGNPEATDPLDRLSSRPDAAILIYPVISLQEPHGHGGSRENLLGSDAPSDLIESLSNHLHVTPGTPPTFLVHTAGDAAVPAENSLLFALALRAANVPVELHLYAHGPHGFGLAAGDPILGTWPAHCAAWLTGQGF